jgi:hypothetical protein
VAIAFARQREHRRRERRRRDRRRVDRRKVFGTSTFSRCVPRTRRRPWRQLGAPHCPSLRSGHDRRDGTRAGQRALGLRRLGRPVVRGRRGQESAAHIAARHHPRHPRPHRYLRADQRGRTSTSTRSPPSPTRAHPSSPPTR